MMPASGLSCGYAGYVRRPTAYTSIADIMMRCREPPVWARSGSRQEAYFFFFIAAVTYGFLAA